MPDTTVVHIGENSPQEVAYKLMDKIMTAEQKTLSSGDLHPGWSHADRKWILDTYAECLLTVFKPSDRF